MFLFCVVSLNTFWKFLTLGNLVWEFLGVIFGPGFLGFSWKPQGIFLGFDICPHSMIPVTRNLKYSPSGASTLFGNEFMKCQRKICAGILSRIKQRFQTILLFLLMFNCFAFFRITAHINVVRALLGQMSCNVT